MVSSAFFAFAMFVSVAVVAQAAHTGSTPHPAGAVYIVHMDKTDSNSSDLETLHLNTLSSLFGGSHAKAKESILYSYGNAMNGFSAKLTPEQVTELLILLLHRGIEFSLNVRRSFVWISSELDISTSHLSIPMSARNCPRFNIFHFFRHAGRLISGRRVHHRTC